MRRFSNKRKRSSPIRPNRKRRRSRKKLRGILKKRGPLSIRRRKALRRKVRFARGTRRAPPEPSDPKLLTAKQKRDRGYSRKLKYCLGPEYRG